MRACCFCFFSCQRERPWPDDDDGPTLPPIPAVSNGASALGQPHPPCLEMTLRCSVRNRISFPCAASTGTHARREHRCPLGGLWGDVDGFRTTWQMVSGKINASNRQARVYGLGRSCAPQIVSSAYSLQSIIVVWACHIHSILLFISEHAATSEAEEPLEKNGSWKKTETQSR